MDPISMFQAGVAVVGLGAQLFGLNKSVGAQQQASQIQQQEINTEEQMNQVRRQAMELYSNRQRMEIARKTQIAAAQSRATTTAQGAQFGSGAAGAYGQEQAQGAFNTQGVNQNEELGENMFNLTDQLNAEKIAMAQAQSQAATGNAWMQAGGLAVKDLNPIGNLFGQAMNIPGQINQALNPFPSNIGS